MVYLSGNPVIPAGMTYQQQVKEANIKHIFDYLRSGVCESRAELVRAMELSATSVSVLVEELQARQFIEEGGTKPTSQPGRRPIRLEFNANSRHIAVFSLSRRGIVFTLLNLKCAVLEHIFVEFESTQCAGTDAGQCYAEKFEEILKKRSRLFDPARTLCVGICVPGVFLPGEHMISMSTSIKVVFSEDSMNAFEQSIGLPVFVQNSSVCLAYAEKKYLDVGKPDDAQTKDLIYVNISDGVGASILSHGDIFTGPCFTAGEIGHMSIDYRGRPCACGNRGCLERYVNLNAILQAVQKKCAECGLSQPQSFEELASSWRDISEVDAVLNGIAELLSHGINNIICATGIMNIAVGGGIEALGDRFLVRVREGIRRKAWSLHDRLQVNYTGAGPNAESVGFAHYFLDKAFTITY